MQPRLKRLTIWLGLGLGVIAVLLGIVANLFGVLTYESHRGYFAPAWDADGETVYFLERNTSGYTWGLGWESFTPPASAYVTEDVVSLRSIDVDSGSIQDLLTIEGSPVRGRVIHHYRRSIFGYLSGAISAGEGPLSFIATMNLPRTPSSDPWSVVGSWPAPDGEGVPKWSNVWANKSGLSEPVLIDGEELITTRGAEAYPAAILLVNADLSYRVLIQNDEFDAHYPTGVPHDYIVERSRRDQILHAREFERLHAKYTAQYRAEGLNESAASVKAYDRMEETGFLPKDPQVTAVVVDVVPSDTEVFEIPPAYFEVGLFKDVAAATADPGNSVRTSSGDYLKYYDDDVGVRLRRYRRTHDEFYVQVGATVYRMTVERPE